MALNDGLLVNMQCCGKCESFADAWSKWAFQPGNPRSSNDLIGMKKKYGRKLAIMGGWDNTGRVSFPEASDEELREALYKCVDTLAPGGGYAFMAFVNGDPEDEAVKRKNAIIEDIYQNYVKFYYKNH